MAHLTLELSDGGPQRLELALVVCALRSQSLLRRGVHFCAWLSRVQQLEAL
jgi:hypothetical protein